MSKNRLIPVTSANERSQQHGNQQYDEYSARLCGRLLLKQRKLC
ncbi:hypothetical protein ABN056_11250 [Providencia vermicola]|nr:MULTISPECIES: hypothetical protein [Providencia]WBA56261.1 hypothetical protein O7C57_15760 [Providencia sp. 21OH12SH02B-Prov]MCR4180912.1 hypothetical protein [Providencia vermicola]WER23154.1 hypothetical protein P2E04_04565 [Providencia stuartii]WER27274.1 hypothetical protein P2E05_04565 [Providencia stuartii]WER31365.1 hypothetical protein P2E06_04565 [Providencia stuartii]